MCACHRASTAYRPASGYEPSIPRSTSSSSRDTPTLSLGISGNGCRLSTSFLLQKPLRAAELTQLVRALTGKWRIERNFAASIDTAQAASRAKTELLANIGHELRTPLNAIIGFSELMSQQAFGPVGDERYLEYAKNTHACGLHLIGVINNILQHAKLASDELSLYAEEVDIGELLNRAVDQADREDRQERALKFTREIPNDLPALQADSKALRQAFACLLDNAVKFTPRGGSITVAAGGSEVSGIHVSIRDTGIGMSSDQIPIALAPFGQVDSGLARKFEGTRLGLPVAVGLIERHGGSLRIESEPRQGTKVTVEFPAARLARAP